MRPEVRLTPDGKVGSPGGFSAEGFLLKRSGLDKHGAQSLDHEWSLNTHHTYG
jgi:hypothetical protein